VLIASPLFRIGGLIPPLTLATAHCCCPRVGTPSRRLLVSTSKGITNESHRTMSSLKLRIDLRHSLSPARSHCSRARPDVYRFVDDVWSQRARSGEDQRGPRWGDARGIMEPSLTTEAELSEIITHIARTNYVLLEYKL
jgi:hypothetical protein